jgi:HlyD family secretion protein
MTRLIPVGPLLILLAALALLTACGQQPMAMQGVIECDEETLAFPEAGRVTTVAVAEGERINAGVELARLDGDQQRLALASATADLAVAQASLAVVRSAARPEDIAAATAKLAASRAVLVDATTDQQRKEHLLASAAVTQQAYDASVARLASATAAVTADEQALAAAQAGGAAPDVALATAQVVAAQARLEMARDHLAKTVLLSVPGPRVVRHIQLKVGMMALPGTPALTLADLDHPYIDVFVPEGIASSLKIGDRASARCDVATATAMGAGASQTTIEGRVERVGERLEYTPRFLFGPADRPHLMIRVRVRLAGPAPAAGVPADVTFTTP